ncbi:MAG: glycosyltransferase, partial [Blastochloris sp.]|nr:glycosyltransferase [Blastochloris sp.]
MAPAMDMTVPRILVVAPPLAVGGTERHLAQVLPALKRRGLDLHLHVLARGGVLEADMSAAGIPIEGPAASLPAAARRFEAVIGLAHRIRRVRPDLVHLFLPEPALLGSLAAELAGHRRRIVSRRSLARYRQNYPGFRLVERILHRRAVVLLGNSSAVVDELVAECGEPAKVGLIHNGVSIPAPLDERTRIAHRASLGLGPETFAIVVVANLIPYKGHADLIAALGRIALRLPTGWRLVLLGRDDGAGTVLDA